MTTQTITQALKEIRERAEKASKGPWKPNVWVGSCDPGWCGTGPVIQNSDEYESDEPGCEAAVKAELDASFIAASRTDIPALLDALEMAVKHIDNLEAHIKAGRFSTLAQKVHSDGTLHAIAQRLTQKEK